ncbi:Zinc finger C3H1 domain-containing protein [Phlyctochytrium planicorne]|nr:Zinc finger C3H1 domain-containing protein [Phlyctochytrium planicorne]
MLEPIRNSIVLLLRAGFKVKTFQEMNLAPEIIIACTPSEFFEVAESARPEATDRLVEETEVEINNHAQEAYSHGENGQYNDYSDFPNYGFYESNGPDGIVEQCEDDPEFGFREQSMSDGVYNEANSLLSPPCSEMELDKDNGLIFEVVYPVSPQLAQDTKFGPKQQDSASSWRQIDSKLEGLESSHAIQPARQRPTANDFNQYGMLMRKTKKFIPDDFRPVIIYLSDDEDEPAPPVRKDTPDVSTLEAQIKKMYKDMAALMERKAKNAASDSANGIRKENGKQKNGMLQPQASHSLEGSEDHKVSSVEASAPDSIKGLAVSKTSMPASSIPSDAAATAAAAALSAAVTRSTSKTNYSKLGQTATASHTSNAIWSKLKEEIASDELLLESALKDLSAKETLMAGLLVKTDEQKKAIAEKEAELEDVEEQLRALQEKVAGLKMDISSQKAENNDALQQIASIRRLVITKGNLAAGLRSGINAKRKQLLDISSLSKTVPPAVANGEVNKKRKRRPSVEGMEPAAKKGDSLNLPTPKDEDLILFDAIAPEPGPEQKFIERKAHSVLTEEERKRALQEIQWDNRNSCPLLFHFPDAVLSDLDICSVEDIMGLQVQREETLDVESSECLLPPQISSHSRDLSSIKFAPYSSFLPRLRSYRLRPSYMDNVKGGLGSTTFSNRIDPSKKFCLFEMQGGTCNDKTCVDQHIRDIQMSDRDIFDDVVKYLDKKSVRDDLKEMKDSITNLQSVGRPVQKYLSSVWGKQTKGSPTKAYKSFLHGNLHESKLSDQGQDTLKCPEIDALKFMKIPILSQILRGLVGKIDMRSERYHTDAISEDEFEAIVKSRPHSVETWLDFAIEMLPSPLTLEALSAPLSLKKSLTVLSRALELNKTDEALWSLYFELSCRISDPEKLREVFEEALELVPFSFDVWWRYYVCESEVERKESILRRIIFAFGSDIVDRETSSNAILSASVQLIKIFQLHGLDELSLTWLLTCLVSDDINAIVSCDESSAISEILAMKPGLEESFTRTNLLPEHYYTLWIILLHLAISGQMPQEVFYDYPYDFLTYPGLYAIQWDTFESQDVIWSTAETLELLEQIIEEYSIGLQPNEIPYFCSLIQCCAQLILQVKGKVELSAEFVAKYFVKLSQCHQYLKLIYFSLFKEPVSDSRDFSSAMTNLVAKVKAKQGDVLGVVTCLCRGVIAYFKDELKVDDVADIESAELALMTAKSRLGLLLRHGDGVDSMETLAPRMDSSVARGDFFLWTNFILVEALLCKIRGSNADISIIFRDALRSVGTLDCRVRFWLEALRCQVGRSSSLAPKEGWKQIVKTLEEAMDDFRETSVPFAAACDSLASKRTRGQILTRGGIVRPLIQTSLKGIGKELRTDLLEILLQSRRETVVTTPSLLNLEKIGGIFGSHDSIPGLLKIAKLFLPETSAVLDQV